MSIRTHVQDALRDAMKARDTLRTECLRMVKADLLLKEKESSQDVSEEQAAAALRAEIRKRRQSIEIFSEHGRPDEAAKAEAEIAIIEEFLPQQLSAEQIEERVRAFLTEHADINHAGKLTGAMKKELGDTADGKLLHEICAKVLGA